MIGILIGVIGFILGFLSRHIYYKYVQDGCN